MTSIQEYIHNQGMVSDWQKAVRVSGLVFLLCFAYAFIRYNLLRSTSLDQVPLYVFNKAVSLAATFLVGFSFVLGPLARFNSRLFVPRLPLRKHFGLLGFGLASLHGVVSLTLLDPGYFPRFYSASGRLTMQGESAVLFGILALFVFSLSALTSFPDISARLHPDQWQKIQRLGYLAYFFVLLHVGIMGWNGWWRADSWRFGMASITFIAALFIVLVLQLRLVTGLLPPKNT